MKYLIRIVLGICIVCVLTFAAVGAMADEELTFVDGAPGVYSTEHPQMLFDNDITTKWCVKMSSNQSVYVIFKTSKAVSIDGYMMSKANDDNNKSALGRSPQKWKLYGSKSNSVPKRNDQSWEVIDSHQDPAERIMSEDQPYYSYAFMFNKEIPAYQYYMLVVDSTFSNKYLQLSEFQLITDDAIPVRIITLKNDGDAVVAACQLSSMTSIAITPTAFCSENGYLLIGRGLTPIRKPDYVEVQLKLKAGETWPRSAELEAGVLEAYDVNENETKDGLEFSKLTIISK